MERAIESDDLAWYCGPRYGWFSGYLVRVTPDRPEILLGGYWRPFTYRVVDYSEYDQRGLAR